MNVTATLAQRLRANRFGLYGLDAATDLLVEHGTWLARADFVDACVEDDGTAPFVDWGEVPLFLDRVAANGADARVALLACELAGVDTRRPLSDLLSGLDDVNADLVMGAVSYALGRHER